MSLDLNVYMDIAPVNRLKFYPRFNEESMEFANGSCPRRSAAADRMIA